LLPSFYDFYKTNNKLKMAVRNLRFIMTVWTAVKFYNNTYYNHYQPVHIPRDVTTKKGRYTQQKKQIVGAQI